MIGGQNAKIEGQNAMISGQNAMIGGQNAKLMDKSPRLRLPRHPRDFSTGILERRLVDRARGDEMRW